MIKTPRDYEEEYNEYDAYLDIDSYDTLTTLTLRIITKFRLNPSSANNLARSLLEVKEQRETRRRIERDIAERELERPVPTPRPRVEVWRETTTAKTTAYRRRIESYLRRYPDATIQEARGHAKR